VLNISTGRSYAIFARQSEASVYWKPGYHVFLYVYIADVKNISRRRSCYQ